VSTHPYLLKSAFINQLHTQPKIGAASTLREVAVSRCEATSTATSRSVDRARDHQDRAQPCSARIQRARAPALFLAQAPGLCCQSWSARKENSGCVSQSGEMWWERPRRLGCAHTAVALRRWEEEKTESFTYRYLIKSCGSRCCTSCSKPSMLMIRHRSRS
jgi:hypothetical protein